LAHEGRRRAGQIAFEVLREPMLLMLLAAGGIYLTLGDLGEALLIVVLASASVVVTIVQEVRSERVLDALRDLTSPRALVIRDGQRKRIAGREVVRGDLVVLNEGDRVPADAILMSSVNLEVDESLLTGEAVPVRKAADGKPPADARPGGDDLPFVYSGSLVARGQGLAEVTATGARSEIGRIGKSLSDIESEPSRSRVKHDAWSGCSRWPAYPSACYSPFCTAGFNPPGSTPCSAESHSAWRCCRRNFRSSLRCSS
jgi:Ca2+-transporting ATPase